MDHSYYFVLDELNFSLEFWILLVADILLIITIGLSYEEYKKDRHKIMGYLTFTWLSLFLVVFFQALAYLFMKFYLFMIYNLLWIPFFLFLILASDSLARYDINPIKMIFFGICSCGLLISSLNFENYEIRTHLNGDLTIYSIGLLSFFSTIFSFSQTFFWLQQMFVIYRNSPKTVKATSKYTVIGGLMIAVFPYVALFSGLHAHIPGIIFLGGGIGAVIITLTFRKEPLLRDLLISISNNLNVRHFQQIQQKMELSEQKYRMLAESASEIIFDLDNKGLILYSNPAQEKTLYYTSDDLIGKNFIQFCNHPEILHLFTHEKAPEPIYNLKVRFVNKRGQKNILLLNIAPKRDKHSKIIGYIVLARDITEIEEKEKILQEKNRQLIQAQKMEALGNLVGGIAHDFNNILQIVIGNAELLKSDSSLSPENQEILQEILQASDKGTQITRQILLFSRKKPEEFHQIDLIAQIQSICKIIERIIPKSLEISLLLPQGPLLINGDETQLQQVIMNLVLNAKDAMPNGGTIRILIKSMDLLPQDVETHPSMKPGLYHVIYVRDTGIGMDESIQTHLFEPFFTTKTNGGGTGLGLFIVYNIINMHKGMIQCYSEVGKGTEFKIFLPASPKSKVSAPAQDAKISLENLRGSEKILIVDDEISIRRNSHRILTEMGYSVILAKNGEEGLDYLIKHKNEVDLIILDYMMPVMDGKQFIQKLQESKLKIPKIIVSTGFANDELDEIFKVSNVKYVLHKPMYAKDILTNIRKALDE